MKKRFLLLSVSALLGLVSLAGCGEQPECPECEICEDPDDTDNPGGNTGENPDDTKPDPDPEPDPSEGLISKEESEWSTEITELMSTYLGGGILPKIDLGDGELEAEFVKNDEYEEYRSYLKITGSGFLVSHLEDAIKTYKEHYWNALMIGETFYASNDLLKVEVEVGKNSNGFFELKAFYNEPFNPSQATTWNDETSVLIKEHFGRFIVPFVYLGTVNYESTITETGSLVVTGGTWNDQVVNQFESAFSNWTVTRDETGENLTNRYATFENNGNTLNASLVQNHNKAELTVSLTEAFDSTNQDSWSKEVVTAMERSLNKNVLPYVYLGTVYPTIDTATTGERTLTLVGKLWDDSILTNASAAFEADGWNITNGESTITFTKNIAQKEDYEVVIEKNADGAPVLRASRTEAYFEEALTAYPDNIKQGFLDKYGEDISIIPFLYLGTEFPTFNEDLAAEHEQDVNKLIITGGRYDERILENYKAKFTKEAGWITEVDNIGENSTDYDGYGKVLAVSIKNFGEHTYKIGLFTLGEGDDETAYLEINRYVNDGVGAKEWSAETLANIEMVLGSGITIPHFETGRDTVEMVFNEDGHLEFDFNSDVNNIGYFVWDAIDKFTKAEWNVTIGHNRTYYVDEALINSIVVTKEFNGKTVEINLSVNSNSYDRFLMFGSINLHEEYDPAKEEGTWSETIANAISSKYKITLPYIYLGSDHPYLYEDTEDGYLKIIGNTNSSEIYANAKALFEGTKGTAQEFLVDNSQTSSNSVVASTTNSDGNLVTVYVDSYDDIPYIALELTEVFNWQGTEWDTDTKATLDESLPSGVTIPYLYLGTTTPTATVEELANGTKISIVGGTWDDAVVGLAEKHIKDDGTFTVFSSNLVGTWSNPVGVTAYKLLDNNSAVRLQLTEESDQIVLNLFIDAVPEDRDETFAKWEDLAAEEDYYGNRTTVTQAMNAYLGVDLPDEIIPMAIAPVDDISINGPYSDYGNKYMTLSSYSTFYSPYYLYLAMKNLEGLEFEVTYNPFVEDEMAGFSAKKTDNNGTLYISIVPNYGDFDDSENGMQFSAMYLDDLSKFTQTEFAESDKLNIASALNGLDLPFVNLGSELQRINAEAGEVTITGYNYSDEIIKNIETTYKNAGWTVYNTKVVVEGRVYDTIGGFKEADSKTYILTVTPDVSSAVYGGGSFGETSMATQINVVMA